MDWKGRQALERAVRERIRRYTRRGRKIARSERRLVWYELGFRDAWEAATTTNTDKDKEEDYAKRIEQQGAGA